MMDLLPMKRDWTTNYNLEKIKQIPTHQNKPQMA